MEVEGTDRYGMNDVRRAQPRSVPGSQI